jgi:hypothetical protein
MGGSVPGLAFMTVPCDIKVFFDSGLIGFAPLSERAEDWLSQRRCQHCWYAGIFWINPGLAGRMLTQVRAAGFTVEDCDAFIETCLEN